MKFICLLFKMWLLKNIKLYVARCNTGVYNKKYIYLFFIHWSWHIVPEILVISYLRAIRSFFVIIFTFVFSS